MHVLVCVFVCMWRLVRMWVCLYVCVVCVCVVCVCGVCVRVRGMCVCPHVCVRMYVCRRMSACVCACWHLCALTCVCVCLHVCVCVCVLAIVMITACIVNKPTPTVQSSSECDCSVKSLILEWWVVDCKMLFKMFVHLCHYSSHTCTHAHINGCKHITR